MADKHVFYRSFAIFPWQHNLYRIYKHDGEGPCVAERPSLETAKAWIDAYWDAGVSRP